MGTTRTAFIMNQTQNDVALDAALKFQSPRKAGKGRNKMNPSETSTQTPVAPVAMITSRVFDLDSFEDVELTKPVPFTPAETVEEALKRLGGDSAKLLEAVNNGLLAEAKKAAADDPTIPWMIEVEDESGKTTLEQFEGTVADSKVVNTMVLNLAKGVYGYNKAAAAKDKAGKQKAKEQAMAFIAGNEVIKNGLKENAIAPSA